MATGDSHNICENIVEDLTTILQKLNTTCAALENAEVKKNGGRELLKNITSAAKLFEKISSKADKCAVLCGRIENCLQESKVKRKAEKKVKRNAVLMEGRDSGFSGSGIYAQETGRTSPTENEEFHSAEEPTSSNDDEDS